MVFFLLLNCFFSLFTCFRDQNCSLELCKDQFLYSQKGVACKQAHASCCRGQTIVRFGIPLLSLVLICHRPTWDMAVGTAWDNCGKCERLSSTHNVPVKSKLQHPPRATPGHLNFWKIFVQIPPSRGRKAVQLPHHRSIPGDQMTHPRETFR